uniref:Uncharacterized protein n=1 Tax=Panagrolaimus sp. ES5 TaxID=591445 RepID=A0AC34GHX7_9BILA
MSPLKQVVLLQVLKHLVSLMSRNPDSHIQVTIPSTSNDVRFDSRFKNPNQHAIIPRQVFSGQNDNVQPSFPHGKPLKSKNDHFHHGKQTVIQRNERQINPKKENLFAPSTLQVNKKENDLKEKVAPKPVQNVTKIEPPSTSKIDVKPSFKKPNPFGDAKPIDTSKKLIEIEQKKLAEQKNMLIENNKLEEQKKIEEQKMLKAKQNIEEKNDDIPAEEISELLNSISSR